MGPVSRLVEHARGRAFHRRIGGVARLRRLLLVVGLLVAMRLAIGRPGGQHSRPRPQPRRRRPRLLRRLPRPDEVFVLAGTGAETMAGMSKDAGDGLK